MMNHLELSMRPPHIHSPNNFDAGQIDNQHIALPESSSSTTNFEAPSNSYPPPNNRTTTVHQPPPYLRDFHCYSAIFSLHEPSSYLEASTNPLWHQAMKEELQALAKTHTWDLVDLSTSKTAIGCKWVYKIKTCVDSSMEQYKA